MAKATAVKQITPMAMAMIMILTVIAIEAGIATATIVAIVCRDNNNTCDRNNDSDSESNIGASDTKHRSNNTSTTTTTSTTNSDDRSRSDVRALDGQAQVLLHQRDLLVASFPTERHPSTLAEFHSSLGAIETDCETNLPIFLANGARRRGRSRQVTAAVVRLSRESSDCDRGNEAVEALNATVRDGSTAMETRSANLPFANGVSL